MSPSLLRIHRRSGSRRTSRATTPGTVSSLSSTSRPPPQTKPSTSPACARSSSNSRTPPPPRTRNLRSSERLETTDDQTYFAGGGVKVSRRRRRLEKEHQVLLSFLHTYHRRHLSSPIPSPTPVHPPRNKRTKATIQHTTTRKKKQTHPSQSKRNPPEAVSSHSLIRKTERRKKNPTRPAGKKTKPLVHRTNSWLCVVPSLSPFFVLSSSRQRFTPIRPPPTELASNRRRKLMTTQTSDPLRKSTLSGSRSPGCRRPAHQPEKASPPNQSVRPSRTLDHRV
mmetsp:Transcript_37509/g.120331  ORF Transcript_37509/g.120331 Transcript_37509/m.120331 type:complete len:281 (+) Transcript_37509:265-1107(+)